MSIVIRICDETGNKYSGFELADYEIIRAILPNENRIGDVFKIGSFDYEIKSIAFSCFGAGITRHTLDKTDMQMTSQIWLWCKTKDDRINEGNITEKSQASIAKDLGISDPYFR